MRYRTTLGPAFFILITAAISLLYPPPVSALWTTDGVTVSTHLAPDFVFSPECVDDGAGGMIVCWVDGRGGSWDIYAQRIDSDGRQLWDMNGIAVCDNSGNQRKPVITSDGAGGAVVIWHDDDIGDYYAQRVDPDGNLLWASGGVPVFSGIEVPEELKAVPDGFSGTLIAWLDSRSGNDDVYAQRLSPGGVRRWAAGGVAVCSHSTDQGGHQIVSDGAGGLIAGWRDTRDPARTKLYAQRVDSSGTALWAADGIIAYDDSFSAYETEVVSDGSGGAIFMWDWTYYNGDYYEFLLLATRVSAAGSTPWTTDGVTVCDEGAWYGSLGLVPDGSGGAIAAWYDNRDGGSYEIYAQKINSSGTPVWATGGIELVETVVDYPVPCIVSDGSGGCIVSWADGPGGNRDIYSQRINSSGTVMWAAGGETACNALEDQFGLRTVADGSGGAILCWHDGRASNDDIYCQKVDLSGGAQWFANGVAVVKTEYRQRTAGIISDGAGGAIISWTDERREQYDLYVQRIDSMGSALWEGWGVPVCFQDGSQYGSRMVADGFGGAILTWSDDRTGSYDNVYGQRVDQDGNAMWAVDGVAVAGKSADEEGPAVAPDGAGGAIIAWNDDSAGTDDIYVQRIHSSGIPLWGGPGVTVCSAAGDQIDCRIEPDGYGGAILAWLDGRDGYFNVYAQRVNSSGTSLWTFGGVPVYSQSFHANNIDISSDGAGGMLITWHDSRNGFENVFVQRLDSNGNTLWTPDGVQATDLYTVEQYVPRVESDAAGGAVVVWQDYRGGGSRIYCQRVISDGTRVWHLDGRSLAYSTGPQEDMQTASDGEGGVVVAWADLRTMVDYDIYAIRIGPEGDLEWIVPQYGIPVCTAAGNQNMIGLASDGYKGAVMVWEDNRNSGTYDELYAQKVKGAIGSVAPVSLDFGTVPVLSSQYRSFTVSNIGDLTLSEEVELTNMLYYSTLGGIADYTIAPGGDQLIQVRFDPEYEGVETCTVDLGSAALSDVFCTGTGLGPVCEIDTVDIDIPGMVMVWDSYDTTFTITNAGGGILNGYVSESDDQFNLPFGEAPFSLYHYDTLEVTVRFKPTAEGTHQCTVETGTYLCGNVTVTGTAYLCPSDSVLYVDADAFGANNGTSWADAFTGLQDALARAGLCEGVTEIWVAEGTYYPSSTDDVYGSFTLRNGLRIYGGFDGTETTLESRSMLVSSTVLSGDIGIEGDIDDNSLHVVTGSYTDSTAVLDGFTVAWGHALLTGDQEGGGYYASEGSPTLQNLIFRNNKARNTGGAIYQRNLSDAKLYNCVFFANEASDFGGGIYNDASSPLIANCTFCRNRVDDSGAALFNENNSNPTIVNTIMWEDSTNSMWAPEIANHGSSFPVIAHSTVQYCGGSGGGWETAYGIDGGKNTQDDPSLLDIATGDLHLLDTSKAIDQGDQTVPGLPSIDLDGNPRVQDSEIDMGAYEGGYMVVRVELETDPSHLELTVDGDTVITSYDFFSRSGAVHEIGAPTPQLQGDTIYSFSHWSDAGDTVHPVVLPGLEVVTYTATYTWAYAYASIDSIVDVPDDQGGWVRVFFRRSHYDDLSESAYPIERYDMHRRVDSPLFAADVLAEGKRLDDGRIEYDGRLFVVLSGPAEVPGESLEVPATAPPGIWEVVGTVSASQQPQYIGLAPTLADSSATIPWTVYYISAHSTTPAVYFDSPADSGYSVDNIAPGVPLGMLVAYNTGSGNQVTWDPSPEPDFQYYRIYRGDAEDFVPGPGNLVHQTATEAWNDPEYDGWDVYYKVTALDHAGNESDPASPSSTTGDDPAAVPKAFALYQNVPNPFNPSTAIRFDLPRAEHVKLCVYNVKGELVATLLDHEMREGRKEVVWLATDGRGCAVSSGVYFYRLIAGDFIRTRKMVLLR